MSRTLFKSAASNSGNGMRERASSGLAEMLEGRGHADVRRCWLEACNFDASPEDAAAVSFSSNHGDSSFDCVGCACSESVHTATSDSYHASGAKSSSRPHHVWRFPGSEVMATGETRGKWCARQDLNLQPSDPKLLA